MKVAREIIVSVIHRHLLCISPSYTEVLHETIFSASPFFVLHYSSDFLFWPIGFLFWNCSPSGKMMKALGSILISQSEPRPRASNTIFGGTMRLEVWENIIELRLFNYFLRDGLQHNIHSFSWPTLSILMWACSFYIEIGLCTLLKCWSNDCDIIL